MPFRIKEPGSFYTHFAGFVAAAAAFPFLLALSAGDTPMRVTLALYGVSAMFLFFSSSLYHALENEKNGGSILRKIDHIAIYIMIAGTYTPFIWRYLSGRWALGLLLTQWLLVATGLALTFVWIRAPRWISTVSYIAMGWVALIPAPMFYRAMPGFLLVMLLAGGVFYSVGAVIYLAKRPDPAPEIFGYHEIFHLFVLAGAATHYAAVFRYLT